MINHVSEKTYKAMKKEIFKANLLSQPKTLNHMMLTSTICVIFLLVTLTGASQGVGVNETGAVPDASAILDATSTTKGALLPRMTTFQRDAIASPANGLTIYNIDCNNFNYYNGSAWVPINNVGGSAPATPGVITGNTTVCANATGEAYSISIVSGATAYTWIVPAGATVATGQGTTAITVDYGSTAGNVCVTASNNCGTSAASCTAITINTAPAAPTATAATGITSTAFDANWTASGGTTTYYLDVATDAGFTTFVSGYNNNNVGNVTTHTVTTTLTCATTYYYRLRAGNSCGTSSSSNTITVVTGSCPPPSGVCTANWFTDARDGKQYGAVTIGSQIWMCENLAYLPSVVGPGTGSTSVAYYYVYGYSGTNVATAKATANYTTYGVLYNWTAAMNGAASSSSSPSGVQGICPAGWHLPSEAEWCTMENTVEAGTDPGCNLFNWRGTNTGGDLKETGTTNWNSPNTGATNTSGFTALPGGLCNGIGSFVGIGDEGTWSCATENSSTVAWKRKLGNTNSGVHRNVNANDKARGHSVRCVKD
ncbi:MAG: hypothetical protein COA57_07385 [Flavobacteriales bacterium]|nr:MAG: hypothetical protein COA57_07385 [Flavobacteriales bacterium]